MEMQSRMFQLVKECQESGLSRKIFAQQHGLSDKSLEYWFRKYRKIVDTLPVGTKTDIDRDSTPSFIEIVNPSVTGSANRQAQIELELASGLRIKIY